MKVGSLFSGIGGLELGLERSGMEIVWQVERDDYATKVLEKHWPNVKRFRDIRECGSQNLEPVDLICGGFPCQPHSLVGSRKASADERDLWGEFARIIGEIKPRWVVAENVPGLLSSESGRFFGSVLRDLAAIGYDAEWDCIPASAFGAHHQRDRVFIIAYPNGINGRLQQITRKEFENKTELDHDGEKESVADAHRKGFEEQRTIGSEQEESLLGSSSGQWNWWSVEPDMGRVAHGVSSRVDRLRCLGNAVVPQVAEWIGKIILNNEKLGG